MVLDPSIEPDAAKLFLLEWKLRKLTGLENDSACLSEMRLSLAKTIADQVVNKDSEIF